MAFDVCDGTPEDLFASTICLDDLSKDARGRLALALTEPRECPGLRCRTLTAKHSLALDLQSYRCDSVLGRLLGGGLDSGDLVTVFADGREERRGLHHGTFIWRSAAALIEGRISGMTNEGTHREPAFNPCQQCDQQGVMEGRLCGRVVRTADQRLTGAQVFAAYRLQFDRHEQGGPSDVVGTVEGVVVRTCETGRQ